MSNERKAIVWFWLAIFFGLEADDIDYAWPPASDEELERAVRLQADSDACYRRACELDGSDDLWARAQAAWIDAPRSVS